MARKRVVELDDNAAECLDALIAAARESGHGTSESRFASNAMRVWYALATRRATLLLNDKLAEQAATLDEAHGPVHH